MANYLIGDVQGCDAALGALLEQIDFSPSRDTLFLLGDLINRGPQSLQVLRRLKSLGNAAQCLLGNHDLHALAVSCAARAVQVGDTLAELLSAEDADQLFDWLRHRPLAIFQNKILMVHAGVLPSWDASKTIALAAEVSVQLRSNAYKNFLQTMYGNEPRLWRDQLQGDARYRVIVNALTRMRFCSAAGEMEFATKEGAAFAPPGCMPWFDVPHRATSGVTVAFGHWSMLGLIHLPHLIALDTGCVWGGCLSAMRIDGSHRELFQIDCKASVGLIRP